MRHFNQAERRARQLAYQQAEQMSWNYDVRQGLIHFYTTTSALIAVKVVLLTGAVFT